MKNAKKQNGSGPLSVRLARLAAVITFCLGLTAAPAAFAQDDPAVEPDVAASAVTDAPLAADVPVDAVDQPAAATAVDEKAVAEPKDKTDAVPVAGGTALSGLSSELMNILLPSLVTLIGLLCAWVLNKMKTKLGLNVSDMQIDAWSKLAEKGANRGAEWARNKAKTLTEGKKLPGPEVLEVGVNWALEAGKAAKLPAMGRNVLEGWIEGHLHTKRVDPANPLPLDLPKA